MRILLHSNAPDTQTGYGIQTGLLAKALKAAGHDVAVSAYYGPHAGPLEVFDETIPVLPCPSDPYGNRDLCEHAIRFFEGDPLGGWIVLIMDVFGMEAAAKVYLKEFNVAAWTPVDHHPVPEHTLAFFADSEAVPIAMSEWGFEQLKKCGLDALYAPLAIDTDVFRPVADAKAVCGFDTEKFIVAMVGMNKGWTWDRKGFEEAFMAFGLFAKSHPDALLFVHAEASGEAAGGIDLNVLAMRSGIPEHQIVFAEQYSLKMGFVTPEMMAARYSAADVLLAPSRGEGFCVPLIEAQACGTPVIVTDFAAQPELIGAGWKVGGEPIYDPPQQSWGIKANIAAITDALEKSYAERGSKENFAAAVAKAGAYDHRTVFETHWQPILAELDPAQGTQAGEPIPEKDGVAVIVPVLNRPENVAPLVESFIANTSIGAATLYFIVDKDDLDEVSAVQRAEIDTEGRARLLISRRGSTFAQKVNSGFDQTTEPWIFVTGDDVRFRSGWLQEARKVSDRFDVIGTNDSPLGVGNPKVKAGAHADHFFVRRSYAEKEGASLGAPVCHEGYRHFYVDVEIIELAKARGVFTPCLTSVVEHIHPDIVENAKRAGVSLDWDVIPEAEDTYRKGWSNREVDQREWLKRAPLVAQQRTGRAKVRAA